MKGDASVAIAGGKKWYIYDYHATVEYEISDGGGEVVASGSLRLPEVHSTNMTSGKGGGGIGLEARAVLPLPEQRYQSEHHGARSVECRRVLVDVRKSILGFVEKFNAQNTSDLDGC